MDMKQKLTERGPARGELLKNLQQGARLLMPGLVLGRAVGGQQVPQARLLLALCKGAERLQRRLAHRREQVCVARQRSAQRDGLACTW